MAPLIELLESELTSTRMRGAYYLSEGLPQGDLGAVLVSLASADLAYCRRVFVNYVLNSSIYNEKIAAGLAAAIFDSDMGVRISAIDWALFTPDDRFEDFCRLVEAGAGTRAKGVWGEPERKRGFRALVIVRRLRGGETVEEVRKTTFEEDSYTFDHLQVFQKRLLSWRMQRDESPG